MATTTDDDVDERAVRVLRRLALIEGVLAGVVIASVILVVHGARPNFGDVPTWLAFAAAAVAGYVAYQQLSVQQIELTSVAKRQAMTDTLLTVQVSNAVAESVAAVRLELVEVSFPFLSELSPLFRLLRIGRLVNSSALEIQDCAVRPYLGGVQQPMVDLTVDSVTAPRIGVLAPGAEAGFSVDPQLYADGREVGWAAQFTDEIGRRWEVRPDGAPSLVGLFRW